MISLIHSCGRPQIPLTAQLAKTPLITWRQAVVSSDISKEKTLHSRVNLAATIAYKTKQTYFNNKVHLQWSRTVRLNLVSHSFQLYSCMVQIRRALIILFIYLFIIIIVVGYHVGTQSAQLPDFQFIWTVKTTLISLNGWKICSKVPLTSVNTILSVCCNLTPTNVFVICIKIKYINLFF